MSNPKGAPENLKPAPAFSKDNQPAKSKRGRPKGSKNKNTMIREIIEKKVPGGVEGYVSKILTTIEEIQEPAKKAKAYNDLMPYIAPQLKSIDATVAMDQDNGRITIVYNTAQKPTNKSDKPDIEVK